ncbi:uncharacterized protein LOC120674281 [Panicum virgatum]|uniref:Uncharacterized protein n=1 Tax=Panicum virgatum TaxID=38727 RepID=A0A8T0W7B5_PANVG|nr:uncharacterized protein LOC120674281 [Panicum virgatum]KAG2642517.1 hypothetical protein PVAP13_2KG092600 [Panicum virgatum]
MPLRRPARDLSAVLPSPILGLAPPASLCVPPQSIQRPPVPDAAHSSRRRVSRSRSAAQLAIRPPFLPSPIRGLAPPASSCMCPQSRRRPLVPDAAHSSHRRSGRPICRRSSSGLPSDQEVLRHHLPVLENCRRREGKARQGSLYLAQRKSSRGLKMHAGIRFVAGQRKSSRGLKMHVGRRFVAGQSRPAPSLQDRIRADWSEPKSLTFFLHYG